MTQWLLNNKAPDDITIEDECELRSPDDAGSIIRCKRHDLALPEIKNHLDTGKKLLNWLSVGQTVFHSLLMKICPLNVYAFLI